MIEKKYDNIFIDLHNLYHRNYHVYKGREEYCIKQKRGTLETGGIYGSLVSINKLRRERLKEDGKMIYLADNSTSIFDRRKQLDPAYKANREKKKESFYKYIDYLINLLYNFIGGDKVIRVENHEADDLAPVALELEDYKKNKSSLVVSGDMDWSRLMHYHGHDVDWFDGKELMSDSIFEGKYGFKPTEKSIIIYKSFRGDESDFIPNAVKGLPSKYLNVFVEEKDVVTILNNLETYNLSDTWKNKIYEAGPRILLNESLVSFLEIQKETILLNTIKCKYNKDILKTLFDNLHLPYYLHPTLAKDIQGSSKDFLEEWDKPLRRKRA